MVDLTRAHLYVVPARLDRISPGVDERTSRNNLEIIGNASQFSVWAIADYLQCRLLAFQTIAYAFISCGFLVYIITYFHSPKLFRTQTGTMLLEAPHTLAVNLMFINGAISNNIDPTPLSFALSAPLFAISYFRFGLFNLFPIAAPVIMENLRDVIIVTDTQDIITI